jgi:hypothetical protein
MLLVIGACRGYPGVACKAEYFGLYFRKLIAEDWLITLLGSCPVEASQRGFSLIWKRLGGWVG